MTKINLALCSKCRKQHDRKGQRYCKACHAAYMREHRPKHSELTPEQRMKSNCRSNANTAQKRGQLVPEPCEVCGSSKVEKHHDDYSKPLVVRWMCRKHHLEHHRNVSRREKNRKKTANKDAYNTFTESRL